MRDHRLTPRVQLVRVEAHPEPPGDRRGRIPRDIFFQNPHRADFATVQQPPRGSNQEGLLAPMTPRRFVHVAERLLRANGEFSGGRPVKTLPTRLAFPAARPL